VLPLCSAPAFAQSASDWQPAITVSTSHRGLALRSQPIAQRLADDFGSTAPEFKAQPAESTKNEGGELGSSLGRGLSKSLVPLGLVAGGFLLADDRNHSGQARGAAQGVAATIAVTELLKHTVRAERPRGGPHSFPSGHAALAFALAAAVSENHHGARLPALGLATAIAASRVNVRAHRVQDVLAGAAIGYFTTSYFMRRNRSSRSSQPAAAAETEAPRPLASNGVGVSARGFSFARSF
jgi:acid phosphatase family membrane protein YuiD